MYDFLTFLGDCGGFLGAVTWIGGTLTQYYGTVNMQNLLINRLYKDET